MPPTSRKPLTIARPGESKLDKRVGALFGKADLELQQVILDTIEPDPHNPRGSDLGDLESLIISIEEEGVRQPIYLRYLEESDRYRLIEGHRRVEASRQARRSTIPAIILRNVSDEEAAALALMLNTQRLEIEQSRLHVFNQRYREQGRSVRDRAKLLGVSIGTISNWDRYGDLQDAGIPLRAFTMSELDAGAVRQQLAEAESSTLPPTPDATRARRNVQHILAKRRRSSRASLLVSELRKKRYQLADEVEQAEYELAYDEIGRALGLPAVFSVEQLAGILTVSDASGVFRSGRMALALRHLYSPYRDRRANRV